MLLIYPVKPADFRVRKPGFLPAYKPGFRGLKFGGFTRVFGCPGIRVAFPKHSPFRKILAAMFPIRMQQGYLPAEIQFYVIADVFYRDVLG